MNKLPLIIGYGGINAGGISSTDQTYRNIVSESLPSYESKKISQSLKHLLLSCGDDSQSSQDIHNINLKDKFFVRPITHPKLFDPKKTAYIRSARARETFPISFAAALPDSFNPGAFHDSKNHPRGLQMAVFAANDAINSSGLDVATIKENSSPDRIAVYAGSGLGQLDDLSMGGMLNAITKGERTITKHLPFSYPQMSADFVNAYVLNNIGLTGHYCGACATFLYNLYLAVNNIKQGIIDIALVGSSEAPILPALMSAFYNMGAMVSDDDLKDDIFARASKPFGKNKGFVMGESAQFVMVASPDFTHRVGAKIKGAVSDVFINADGGKRSISSPGPGNYITMGKAVAAAEKLMGADKLANSSYVHAHGTSTPQNRVTESEILSAIAKHFKIKQWDVVAIKSYLGHSQACAAADQMSCGLSFWNYGIMPGINTIDDLADDVEQANLRFVLSHEEHEPTDRDICIINSKGFGGNNASAVMIAPEAAYKFYEKAVGKKNIAKNTKLYEKRLMRISQHFDMAEKGKFNIRYQTTEQSITKADVQFTEDSILIKGYSPVKI